MAYELFWQAIAAYQAAEYADEQALCAENIFGSLFEHYSSFSEFHNYLTSSPSLLPTPTLGGDWRVVDELVEDVEIDGTESIGNMSIIAGYPNHLPTQEMIEQLKGLRIPATPYIPDSVELIPSQNLRAAAFIHGSIIFISWLQTRWGDDLQPAQRELERLFSMSKKFTRPALVDDLLTSLSKRTVAQMAFIQRDYSAALKALASSIEVFSRYVNSLNANILESTIPEDFKNIVLEAGGMLYLSGARLLIPAPWLTRGVVDAKTYLQAAKQLNSNGVDWQAVVAACEVLSSAALEHRIRVQMNPQFLPYKVDYSVYNITTEESVFWTTEKGYAESQLTPDQLRSLYEGREDESAQQRLRTYFFPDGLWEHLPDRAQQALVLADKQMVAGTGLSRSAVALNELRIATEEVLHRYLWQPVSAWAKGQSSPSRGVAAVLKQPGRHAPGLDDFVQLLYTDGVKDYLRSVDVDGDGIRFLTTAKRAPDYFQRLLRARNQAEHGGGYDPVEIRALYAEALGIGRKGVLPEMLRLLARRPERRRPDPGDLNL